MTPESIIDRYGRHDRNCPLRMEANLPGDIRCTCGFSAALAAIDSPPPGTDWRAGARAKAAAIEAEREANIVSMELLRNAARSIHKQVATVWVCCECGQPNCKEVGRH